MAIPENDTQLWVGFNNHGLYAKRAERDKNGNPIDTTYATKDAATTTAAGLMSAADKGKLDTIESGAEANLIESVKVDGTALSVDANKAVNIPLASATDSGNETVYVTGAVTGQDKQKWDNWASAVFPIIPIPNTVVIGGRTYPTVTIGNQVWMTENLDFQWNGLSVGEAGTSSEESRANYCDNEPSVYGVSGNKYGLLYNWTALEYLNSNREELLPGGWRIPTWSDCQTLANSLGDDAGVKMKSTTGWADGGNGTNASGFTAVPSGYYNGGFLGNGSECLFWTSSPALISGLITVMALRYNDNRMNSYSNYKHWQHSIRLVKDAT